MQPPLFYAPPEKREGDCISLSKEESHHAAKVLRLKRGTLVIVVDGLGSAFRGELLSASPTKAQVKIIGEIRNFGEPMVRLTLAAGLSSGHKFSTTVEKATEIGVKRVVPLICEKSRVKIEDSSKSASKVKRLERVALAAIKQCRRAYRPEIRIPCKLEKFVSEVDRLDLNLIFTPDGKRESWDKICGGSITPRATVMVGPEAGFSSEEIELAIAAGFKPISLGDRILRTETAGPLVAGLVMQALGEFN